MVCDFALDKPSCKLRNGFGKPAQFLRRYGLKNHDIYTSFCRFEALRADRQIDSRATTTWVDPVAGRGAWMMLGISSAAHSLH